MHCYKGVILLCLGGEVLLADHCTDHCHCTLSIVLTLNSSLSIPLKTLASVQSTLQSRQLLVFQLSHILWLMKTSRKQTTALHPNYLCSSAVRLLTPALSHW